MVQAGQLLVVRKRLTLEDGITTIDTGITQQFLGVDPPVGGSDPTADAAAVASRIEVKPLAPIPPWVDADVHHSEPRFNTTTKTIEVDFFVAAGTGPVDINVMFWDPHTLVTPMDADAYNEFACVQPSELADFGSGPNGHADSLTLSNPADGFPAGAGIVVAVSMRTTDNFADPASAPVADDAGWTVVRRGALDLGDGDGIRFVCFFRLSAAGDPATWSFSWAGGTDNGGSAQAYAFAPVNQDTPVMVDAPVVVQTSPTDPLSIDAPSLTLTEPLGMLMCFWVADQPFEPRFVVPVSMQDNQGSVRNNAPLPGLQMSASFEPITNAGPTGVRNGTLALDASGMAYSIALSARCGIFPDGSGG